MESRNLRGSVELLELIYKKKLRTVDDPTCPGSSAEYLIYIDLKDEFRKKLNFKTPYHGHLYAYAYVSKEVQKILDENDFTLKGVRVDLADWDDKFVISFEENAKEIQFFCKSADVKYLLENCLRIPMQRILNN